MSKLENVPGAFEERMAMRAQMMARAGVSVPSVELPGALEQMARQMVVDCMTCAATEECAAWLDAPAEGAVPPEFCPNAERIAALRQLGL